MVTVWLIRHGESEGNAGFETRDPSSIGLTRLGQRQSRAVANHIAEKPAKILVSPFARSQHSANYLVERFPDTPVEQWPIQEFTYLPTEAYQGTTVKSRQSANERYWQQAKPSLVTGPGAESFEQFIDRAIETRDRLMCLTDGPVALYSHKKFIAGLLWVLLTGRPKISARRMRRYRGFDLGLSIKNAVIIPLQISDSQISILPFEERHLKGVQND